MNTELIPMNEIERMAAVVAKSGLFGVKTMEQAAALMLIAHAEGLHPAIAARDYHVIQGRPALKSDAMLARFQAAGGKVEWLAYTDAKVAAKFSHPQGGVVEVDWTLDRARAAGLGTKDNWKAYPRQMLRARVISEGIRTVFPGCVSGVVTPEEAADMPPEVDVTAQGETLPAKPSLTSKLKAVAAAVDTTTGEVRPPLTLTEPGLPDYIAQAATLVDLEEFRDDVAATDAKSAAGKAARKAYNARLAMLSTPDAVEGIKAMADDLP